MVEYVAYILIKVWEYSGMVIRRESKLTTDRSR